MRNLPEPAVLVTAGALPLSGVGWGPGVASPIAVPAFLLFLCYLHTARPAPDDHQVHGRQRCREAEGLHVPGQLPRRASRSPRAPGVHRLRGGLHVCE